MLQELLKVKSLTFQNKQNFETPYKETKDHQYRMGTAIFIFLYIIMQ